MSSDFLIHACYQSEGYATIASITRRPCRRLAHFRTTALTVLLMAGGPKIEFGEDAELCETTRLLAPAGLLLLL